MLQYTSLRLPVITISISFDASCSNTVYLYCKHPAKIFSFIMVAAEMHKLCHHSVLNVFNSFVNSTQLWKRRLFGGCLSVQKLLMIKWLIRATYDVPGGLMFSLKDFLNQRVSVYLINSTNIFNSVLLKGDKQQWIGLFENKKKIKKEKKHNYLCVKRFIRVFH